MGVADTFDRNFNKCMRGYNPEDVDAAVDALLRYCTDLEEANREFEIANNDLIDERSELTAAKASLTEQNATLSDTLSRLEKVYNEYREKFGEASDLVSNAKVSAAEIVTRAQTKSDLLLEQAEKQREAKIKALDAEILARKAKIEELDACYAAFREALQKAIAGMLSAVQNGTVAAAMPDLPAPFAAKPDLRKGYTENLQAEKQTAPAPAPEKPTPDDSPLPPAVTPEQKTDASASSSGAKEAPAAPDAAPEDEVFSALGPVWRDRTYPEGTPGTPVSHIRTSVESVNDRVIQKKQTPHRK